MNQPETKLKLAANPDESHKEEDIIGIIKYLGFNGGVRETLKLSNPERYLSLIKEELLYNPTGFQYQTITKDAKIRKALDDILYNHFGTDNPYPLEHYQEGISESENLKECKGGEL